MPDHRCRTEPLQLSALLASRTWRRGTGKDILLGIRPEAITDPEGADRNSGNIVPLRNRVA